MGEREGCKEEKVRRKNKKKRENAVNHNLCDFQEFA